MRPCRDAVLSLWLGWFCKGHSSCHSETVGVFRKCLSRPWSTSVHLDPLRVHLLYLILLALAVPPKHGHGAIRGGNLTPGGKHERHHKQVAGNKKSLFLGGLLETGVIFWKRFRNHQWRRANGNLPVHRHGAQGLGQLSRDWVSGQLWRTTRPKTFFFFDLCYCPVIFKWPSLKINTKASFRIHVQKSKKVQKIMH